MRSGLLHTYHPSSSYLRVNMDCALWLSVSGPLLQRSHIGRPPFEGSDLGVPNLHYTPNLARTILAYKLVWPPQTQDSVSPRLTQDFVSTSDSFVTLSKKEENLNECKQWQLLPIFTDKMKSLFPGGMVRTWIECGTAEFSGDFSYISATLKHRDVTDYTHIPMAIV